MVMYSNGVPKYFINKIYPTTVAYKEHELILSACHKTEKENELVPGVAKAMLEDIQTMMRRGTVHTTNYKQMILGSSFRGKVRELACNGINERELKNVIESQTRNFQHELYIRGVEERLFLELYGFKRSEFSKIQTEIGYTQQTANFRNSVMGQILKPINPFSTGSQEWSLYNEIATTKGKRVTYDLMHDALQLTTDLNVNQVISLFSQYPKPEGHYDKSDLGVYRPDGKKLTYIDLKELAQIERNRMLNEMTFTQRMRYEEEQERLRSY